MEPSVSLHFILVGWWLGIHYSSPNSFFMKMRSFVFCLKKKGDYFHSTKKKKMETIWWPFMYLIWFYSILTIFRNMFLRNSSQFHSTQRRGPLYKIIENLKSEGENCHFWDFKESLLIILSSSHLNVFASLPKIKKRVCFTFKQPY